MKKIISLATIFTVAAMVAGPGVAQGATAAELQAQINQLLATLQGLQSQLASMGGGTTGTVPAACAGISAFNTNLTIGSTGADVKCLQALLNTSADTQVAATGAGSPGNETMYFGGLTQSAVAKYQVKHAITPPAGYFGPITRTSVNPMLLGTGTGTGTSPLVPAGCNGAEGSYTVTLSASPVSRTVNGGVGIEAYGFDVKAINSDVYVGSVDLQTAVTVGGTAWNPTTFITGIKVYRDSLSDANLVKTYSGPVFNLDTAGVYYTSLTGLNLKIEKDTTHKVLVVLDTVESSDNNRVVTLNVYGNGVRGRDCLNIDRYQALATTRVLTIQPSSGNATLVLSLSSTNPDSTNVYSNLTTGVQTNTPVMKFNAKAQSGNVTLTRLEVGYASNAATVASGAVPSILMLYDGGTLIQSCTPAAAEDGICTFENFRLPISADTTKELTVMANWAAKTNTGASAFRPNVPTTSTHSIFERSNGSQVNTTVTANPMQGNTIFVYEQGAKLTWIGGTATPVGGSTTQMGSVTAVMKFKIEAFGQTLSQIVNASNATNSTNTVWAELIWASNTTVPWVEGTELYTSSPEIVTSKILTQSIMRDLSDGESAEVTVNLTAQLLNSTTLGAGGNVRGRIYAVNWADSTLAVDVCQGETCSDPGGIAGGNLTDNWVTNWAPLTGGL